MTVEVRAAEISNGKLRLDIPKGGFTKDLKNAQSYDTEPVTSASDDDMEDDTFADVSLQEDDGEYARRVKSAGSSDASETVFTASTMGTGTHRGRALAIKPSSDTGYMTLEEEDEEEEIGTDEKKLSKGLCSDMIHVSGYLRLDKHTQFLLSEHGIRSLDDLGSLRTKKWRYFHDLVQAITGDDEQARKVAVLRQWVRTIQMPVEEGERIPKDWRELFLKALPKLKADARKTDWTNSEDVQMRLIDAMPYSWSYFIDSMSQCGLSLPYWDDEEI